MTFTTEIETTDGVISGPLRHPRQMLADQEYGDHKSIHDDDMADKLGFSGAPIEGPTHFSQFDPLMHHLWGDAWFETGCLSAHYQNMVVEGEQVQAFAEVPADGVTHTRVWAAKADGTPVLEASAGVGADNPPTVLDERMAKLRPTDRLVILEDLTLGQRGAQDELVVMEADQHMGLLYPFSLNEKLAAITEHTPWYDTDGGAASPWGRAVIPREMISVLVEYTNHQAGFAVKGPAVGLFADQEIKLVNGPLFVGQQYVLRREIVALSESRRTESYWVRSSVHDVESDELLATMLLNHATLKDSYADYPAS